MFRRADNLIVTQAEHSRLSGVLALHLGRFLDQPVKRLAGAIALHDWPHFGNCQADVIEIGRKTAEQQRELVERLSGPIPLDAFSELIMREHWRRLSAKEQPTQGEESYESVNQQRIAELMVSNAVTDQGLYRSASWTTTCDAVAFYLSRGGDVSEDFAGLSDLAGDTEWGFTATIADSQLVVDRWRVSSKAFSTGMSDQFVAFQAEIPLLTFEADGYPDRLTPVMHLIRCKFSP